MHIEYFHLPLIEWGAVVSVEKIVSATKVPFFHYIRRKCCIENVMNAAKKKKFVDNVCDEISVVIRPEFGFVFSSRLETTITPTYFTC